VRNLLRLFGTSYATVQLLQDGMTHMAALDGELGYEKLAAHYPLPLLAIPPPHPVVRSLHATSHIIR
jgi:hypothetical protein